MLLPDTSIWVAYLRPGSAALSASFEDALDSDDVLTCGPVIAELLAGSRQRDRDALRVSLHALRWADLGRADWFTVGSLASELRDRGDLVPLTDLEIAVAAHGAGATLWTTDSDFLRVAAVLSGLDVRLENA